MSNRASAAYPRRRRSLDHGRASSRGSFGCCSFAHQVVPILAKEGVGILGMKSIGGGLILRSLTVTPIECLHYAMNLPTSTVITGIDGMEILKQALEAVRTFRPMTSEQVAALLEKTAEAAGEGKFELFKTESRFDGTAKNPQWPG